MSTPAPAAPPLAIPAGVHIVITLDVQDLARACSFYKAAMDYSVVATERPGMRLEARLLTSTRYPTIALRLRAALGKRVGGSQPGGMMKLSYTDTLEAARVAHLGTLAHFIHPLPPNGEQPQAVSFNDPDGYLIELCRDLPPLLG